MNPRAIGDGERLDDACLPSLDLHDLDIAPAWARRIFRADVVNQVPHGDAQKGRRAREHEVLGAQCIGPVAFTTRTERLCVQQRRRFLVPAQCNAHAALFCFQ